MTASRTPSEIWSATLSGWPSVTDSEVNRYSFSERFVLIGWAATPRFGKRGEFGSGNLSASFFAVTLLAAVVVDDQRDALEPVPLPEPILDEEAVVAREPGAVVHLDREAWRADVVLGHVDQLQALAAHVRRLAGGLDVGDEAVELGRRDARAGA